MKSVMSHQFSRVPDVQIPRSSFNRSHGHKTTFDGGWLVPVFCDEALPGDSFNVNMAAIARMSTPAFPIMDNLYLDTFFFAVPIRLLWDNFQKFMGEQDNPGDSTDYTVPVADVTVAPLSTTGYTENSLQDYMGLPTQVTGIEHNQLHMRAYNLIWNQWFRDENLQNSLVVDKDDGPDDPADYQLRRRGKRHDYITSSLPWPQKGDSVSLPLGSTADVLGLGVHNAAAASGPITARESDGGSPTYTNAWSSASQNIYVEDSDADGHPDVYADLSNATAATINQLRQAFQIQRLLERDARGGTRYTEIIRSHFGVTSPDQRLQRPEYLGGGSTPININPVVHSATFTDDAGDLAAFATANISGHGFSKSFTEHCVIIGLVNVRADLTYQHGMERMWSRQTRYDYFWPSLAQIGEQAVLNKEVFMDGTATDEDVFGYQERYAEYRYKPSKITGAFRANAATPLDAWHLSQQFFAHPTLGNTFIQEDPPIDRVINTPSEPHFIFDSYFSMQCARPMPLFGVPGMIDHF